MDDPSPKLSGGGNGDTSLWRWPAVVFLTGLTITALVSWLAWAGSRARDVARFENAVQRTEASIIARLEIYTGLLRGAAGLFAAEDAVTPDAFSAFVRRIDPARYYPGVQGIGFARRVTPEERSVFLARIRDEGQPDFEITPAGEREEYFPIVFLEPGDRRNLQAMGFDMFSEPTRRAAMVRARDEGRPAASGRVLLVQEIDAEKQAGFLIYVPVFRGAEIPRTVEERRAQLIGFVYSPFRAGDLFTGILGQEQHPRAHFEVYDGEQPRPEALLYRFAPDSTHQPRFTSAVRFQVADRAWTVRYFSTADFEAASNRRWTGWLMLGGIAVSALFAAITLALARAEAEARRRGREVLAQREELHVTLASIGDAVVSTDAQGRVVFMNSVAEQLTGWPLAEARERPMHEVFAIVNEDTGRRIADPVAEVLRHGLVVGLANHTALVPRQGGLLPIEDSAAPIRDADGTLRGVVLVFHDVTERRQAEDALRERERLLRAAASGAHVGLAIVDRDHRYLFANEAYRELLGLPAEQSLDRRVPEALPDVWPQIRPRLERAFAGESVTYELSRQPGSDPAGPAHWFAVTYEPQKDPGGMTVVVVIVDITERKRAEQQLRDAADRLHFMAESMPQKIFTARPNGEIDYFNQQWMEFTGLTFEQIRHWGWLQFIHPDDVEENVRLWKQAIATGEPFQFEHRFRRHDGVYRWHLSRASAMRDATGRIAMWIGSNTDIDDQKQAEETLELTVAERTAALRETNEQLEAFVYSIAHDLRGPVRAINGYAQLLAEDHSATLTADGQHFLQRVRASAELMDRLIIDLLAFGRTARSEIELTAVAVADAWAIARQQVAAEAERTHATILTEGELPLVCAHEATLAQVLANLLGNAIKFVAPGVKPRIRFWSEDHGPVVRLWLEDNGIGIPPELHERVFRVFERLHGSRYEGTGIGLAIVRKGVERMRGHVGLESAPQKGSRFWIELQRPKD